MRRFIALAFVVGLAPSLAGAQEAATPMINGAEVRIQAKKWEDARRFLEEEAIPSYPENAELHYLLGVVYVQGNKRDSQKAALEFAKAKELAGPEENAELSANIDKAVKAIWGPLVNAAAKAADAGDTERAEKLLKQAVQINPDGPEAWINLGAVYLRQKKNAEAVAAYEKAAALQPDNNTLLYNLGITYHQLGRDAKKAGDQAKTSEYYGKAEATYKKYLEKKPGDSDILNNLAALYQEQGNEAKMRETLGEVTTADSASQEDFYNAGRAFLKGQDYAKAEEPLRKTIAMENSLDPASVEMAEYSMEYLGLALIQQKKTKEAIDVLEGLVQRKPDNGTAYEYLGHAYRDAGRTDDAQKAFAKSEQLKETGAAGESGQGRETTSE